MNGPSAYARDLRRLRRPSKDVSRKMREPRSPHGREGRVSAGSEVVPLPDVGPAVAARLLCELPDLGHELRGVPARPARCAGMASAAGPDCGSVCWRPRSWSWWIGPGAERQGDDRGVAPAAGGGEETPRARWNLPWAPRPRCGSGPGGTILAAAGTRMAVSGAIIRTPHGAFIVTQECIFTPLIRSTWRLRSRVDGCRAAMLAATPVVFFALGASMVAGPGRSRGGHRLLRGRHPRFLATLVGGLAGRGGGGAHVGRQAAGRGAGGDGGGVGRGGRVRGPLRCSAPSSARRSGASNPSPVRCDAGLLRLPRRPSGGSLARRHSR